MFYQQPVEYYTHIIFPLRLQCLFDCSSAEIICIRPINARAARDATLAPDRVLRVAVDTSRPTAHKPLSQCEIVRGLGCRHRFSPAAAVRNTPRLKRYRIQPDRD